MWTLNVITYTTWTQPNLAFLYLSLTVSTSFSPLQFPLRCKSTIFFFFSHRIEEGRGVAIGFPIGPSTSRLRPDPKASTIFHSIDRLPLSLTILISLYYVLLISYYEVLSIVYPYLSQAQGGRSGIWRLPESWAPKFWAHPDQRMCPINRTRKFIIFPCQPPSTRVTASCNPCSITRARSWLYFDSTRTWGIRPGRPMSGLSLLITWSGEVHSYWN